LERLLKFRESDLEICTAKTEKGKETLSISVSGKALSSYLSLFSALSTAIPTGKAFNPTWFISRILSEEQRKEATKEYKKSFEKFLEKLEEHYTNIHNYLSGEKEKIGGEEAIILNIARELGLEETIRQETTFRNFKEKTRGMLTELKNGLAKFLEGNEARISRTLLGKALGNIVESVYSPATIFIASHAYANAHQICIVEDTITLTRTTKEGDRERIMRLVDEIIMGNTKEKMDELRGILETIMANEREYKDARYAASRLLSAINNDDSTVLQHIMLLAKATLVVEKIMEELASGKVSKKTIERAKKALSEVMLSQIEITQSGNEVLIKEKSKDGERKLAQIKMTKMGEGEGYISLYYTNPATKASLELMVERAGRQTDIMGYEWIGWNLLPIYGGEMIRVVDGKPCFKKYDFLQGRGSALRRTITYHSLFTLANYYEAISHGKEEYAFGIVEKALGSIMGNLEGGTITKKEKTEMMKTIDKAIKNIKDEKTKTLFTDLEGLKPLDPHYREALVARLEKIKTLINDGRYQAAKNEITRMLSAARTLKAKIGKRNREEFRRLVGEALTTKNKKEAREKIEELTRLIDDPGTEEKEETGETKSTIEEAVTYMQLLEEMHPEILQTPKPKLSDDIKQQLRTGLIVGLMSTFGSIIAYTIMAILLAKGSTAILDMLNFRLPALAWIVIGAAITILTICLLKKGFIGKGKAIALSVSMGIGLWSYARGEGRGILDEMEFFAPLSAILWVWDEFDDFQDGYNRLKKRQEPPDITDTLELWLLPMILGMFGTWMGIDQKLITARIPGRWGFAKYAAEANIPSPWDVVVNAIYEIIAFVLANVIASGAMGVGWIIYTVGSVLGSIIMSSVLSNVLGVVFS